MRRFIAGLLAVAILLLPAPASATRADDWRARAIAALSALDALPDSTQAFPIAYEMQAIAWLYGWDDPRIDPLLNRLYDVRQANGGWGLGFSYDALSDGTTNGANTTYTVTISGHVGFPLLEAYKAGKVPKADVQTLVNLLMSTNRIDYNTSRGQCIAYSRNSNDDVTYGCVHNVNAIAGWFLQEANAAGVQASGLQKLVLDISRMETYAYQPTINGRVAWWRYMDTTALSDSDHNSAEAEALYYLHYTLAREPVYQHMVTEWADNSAAPIAHMRLTSMPAGPGSTSGNTTLWCVLGDDWTAEYDAFLVTHASNATRLAQAAYYAARNSIACEV